MLGNPEDIQQILWRKILHSDEELFVEGVQAHFASVLGSSVTG
ncbi:hypothetical protein [Verrucomicrobium sp. BvORR034]|nr:hypothetical protein [Verrucomicrobium sp. BvORR034]